MGNMMKIKQLQLQNYGRFENLTVDFAPTENRVSNVTVIVGNNGAGKSQILQALATGLSWFVNGIRNEMSGFEIDNKLIKNNTDEANIIINFDFDANNFINQAGLLEITRWNTNKVRDGKNGKFPSYTKELNKVIKSFRNKNSHISDLSLPLIVFYPVERSIIGNSQADILSSQFNRFDAYHACVDSAGIDFYDFFKWFRQQEDIENEIKANVILTESEYIERLNTLIAEKNEIENIYNSMKDENSFYSKLVNTELGSSLNNLMEKLERLTEINQEKIDYLNSVKHISTRESIAVETLLRVKKSIEEFTGFRNPRIRRQGTPTMIVEKDGEELDVNQLSQGEKSLLALVGDIARRLAILNPSLDDPLQGEGVVMIDEVDLHLHPKWQHDLIDKLVRTFPKVQFILTTHSPHIVSDRQDILVYSLDNGQLQTIGNVYGEDANTVLNDVFHVPYRTPEIDKAFNGIRRAISHKELESAESQINNIAKKVSSSNTELLKVRLMLAQAKLAQNKVS